MLSRRIPEGRQKEPGVDHPVILGSVGNLALVLLKQGRYKEAEMLLWRVLEGQETALGAHHPVTVVILGNLANEVQLQGRHEEAETLFKQALERKEKGLGASHPSKLVSFYHYASFLSGLARYDGASELYQRACDGFTQRLGSQHLGTIRSLKNFSAMQRRMKEAKSNTEQNTTRRGAHQPYQQRQHSAETICSPNGIPLDRQSAARRSVYPLRIGPRTTRRTVTHTTPSTKSQRKTTTRFNHSTVPPPHRPRPPQSSTPRVNLDPNPRPSRSHHNAFHRC